MAKQLKSYSLYILFLLIPTVLAGCAVMKVDVDVYKGPLANHQAVQMEQMAVMAVGAKPLLIGLRNSFLSKAISSTPDFLGVIDDQKIMTACENDKKCDLENALSVNAILSLYQDRISGEIGELLNKSSSAIEQYDLSKNKFYGDEKRKERLIELLKLTDSDSKTLAEGYQALLKSPMNWDEWKKKIFQGHNALCTLKNLKGVSMSVEKCKGIFESYKIAKKELTGANAGFQVLSQEKIVRMHAEWLSVPEDKIEAFVKSVVQIAEGYNGMRDASHRLLKVSLEALAATNNDGEPVLGRDSASTIKVIDIALKLMNKKHLNAILKLDSNPYFKSLEFEKKGQLVGLLKSNQKDMALNLLWADAEFQTNDAVADKMIREVDKKKYISDIKRKYGLTVGPSSKTDGTFSEALNDVTNMVKDVRGDSLTGLARGRLDSGLESLIENYLEKHKGGLCSSIACKTEQSKLVNALVRFAEKVLFVANYSPLLDSETKGSKAKKSREKYTLVLQAVGNSILNQADELHHQSSYRLGLKQKWKTEAYAARSSLYHNAGEVHALLVDQLTQEYAISQAAIQAFKAQVSDAIATVDGLQISQLAQPISKVKPAISTLKDSVEKDKLKAGRSSLVLLTHSLDKYADSIDIITTNSGLATRKSNKDKIDKANAKLHLLIGEVETLMAQDSPAALKETLDTLKEGGTRQWANDKGANAVNAVDYINRLIQHLKGTSGTDNLVARHTLEKRKFNVISIGEIDGIEKDPRNILDQLISALHYQHIAAVAANGANSPGAVKIAEAIAVASKQRSGMVYIRPSSAYLRSSYPSTLLQGDPRLGWNNMLIERRSPDQEGKQKLDLVASLDKQFWQNVNSVRVKGGGKTNYVITKDDIGNWYVKAYSADPASIIKSAQNLALFAAGSKMGINLLSRLSPKTSSDKNNPLTKAQQEAESNKPVMEKLFEKYKTEYSDRTDTEFDSISKLLDGALSASIQKGWDNDDGIQSGVGSFKADLKSSLKAASSELTDAHDEMVKAESGNKKDTQTSEQAKKAGKIIKALNAMKYFQSLLTLKIQAIQGTPKENGAAIRVVNRIVNRQMKDSIEERIDTAKDYESAVLFIGDAIGQ